MERIKELERENRELKQANEIERKQPLLLTERSSTANPNSHDFIEDHKQQGMESKEPICRVLPIIPSIILSKQ